MKNRRKTDVSTGVEVFAERIAAGILGHERGRLEAIDQCIAVVLRHFQNDWAGVKCLAELEKLK